MFCAAYFAAAPSLARDMMGVIDRHGNTVVPCQYKRIEKLDLGFFLCEGFDSGPGARSSALAAKVLTGMPKDALEAISNYRFRSPKQLLDRDGKVVKLSIPKGTLLADVFISPSHILPYNNWRADHKKEAAPLPEDTLLEVMGVDGFGVCDLSGKYLVEPKYHSLSMGGVESGKISVAMWDAQSGRLVQSQLSLEDVIKRHYLKFARGFVQDNSVMQAFPSLFRDGLAVFRDENRLYGYKDKSGKIVIPPKYYNALPFSDGMAPVRLNPIKGPEKGKECYIDKTGKIISPIFWRAGPFFGNFAEVGEKGDVSSFGNAPRRDLYGLIDRHFNYFIKPTHCCIDHFKEGFWVIQESRQPAIVLNAEGKEIFRTPEPAYLLNRERLPFSFHTSSAGTKRIFFYTPDGKLQRELIGEVERFGPIPTVVRTSTQYLNGTRGLIDENGNWLIKPEKVDLLVVDEDRIIKTEHGTTFVKEDWDSGADRMGNFVNFLGQHLLVGMRRTDVEALLGKGAVVGNSPNMVSYTVAGMGAWCGNAYRSVQIEYASERVKRWRYYGIDEPNVWKE